MSFKHSSKKDEEDLKEYKAKVTTAEETTVKETDVKGLQKELGANFSTFANADETFRKRLLKEDYAKMKAKYCWLYDQPITTKSDV